jgi:NADPH:quinone reductase-like Zn-dependent oxidoreductase
MEFLDCRTVGAALAIVLPSAYITRLLVARVRRGARARLIPPAIERVLVLGASSGVGRAIVKQYAAPAAKIFAVGRRADQLTS